MLFHSGVFLAFFAGLAAVLLSVSARQARILILLAASYIFYGFWSWHYLGLILASTLVDYLVSLKIARGGPARRIWLAGSITFNLALLGVFKYFDFFAANFNGVGSLLGIEAGLPILELTLPVGISFYTFQTLSYTIDIYRGRYPPCRDLTQYALYVSFFPQLVAGPIIRYPDFKSGLDGRGGELCPVGAAFFRFAVGCFKKMVLADTLALYVDRVFSASDPQALETLCATVAFGAQIYFDFSGYSDMALALAMLLGFRFPENFNFPYLARSPREFWRRWHISLSGWLRDYLYIPLGGSRHGMPRLVLALMMTMLLGGLWHGAAWGFVIWGGWHGLALVLGRLMPSGLQVPRFLAWAVTFAVVMIGWLPFRARSFEVLERMMASLHNWPEALAFPPVSVLTILLSVAVGNLWLSRRIDSLKSATLSATQWASLTGLLAAVTMLLKPETSQRAFIYFQF